LTDKDSAENVHLAPLCYGGGKEYFVKKYI